MRGQLPYTMRHSVSVSLLSGRKIEIEIKCNNANWRCQSGVRSTDTVHFEWGCEKGLSQNNCLLRPMSLLKHQAGGENLLAKNTHFGSRNTPFKLDRLGLSTSRLSTAVIFAQKKSWLGFMMHFFRGVAMI